MFDQDAESILQTALNEAISRKHEYVCIEHLLFAIVNNSKGKLLIKTCGGNINRLNAKLDNFFNKIIDTVILSPNTFLEITPQFTVKKLNNSENFEIF